jgi:four helix bundle protein
MEKENVIRDKSYRFGLRIIKTHIQMSREIKQYDILRQLLRSGTSIGANVEEAIGGISKKEFTSKMSIAYKEARETHYWLRLLRDSEIADNKLMSSLILDCEELLRILYTIIKSSKA